MNKQQTRYILGILFSIVLAGFIACEGPAGPQGERGQQGEQGPRGTQGEEGTANVIYSEWIDLEWNGADEDDYKRMDIIEPMITEEFMSTGTVLMFLSLDVGTESMIFALPLTTASGQAFIFFMRPEGLSAPVPGVLPEEAGLSFYIQRDGGVASGGLNEIRYILIPDGIPAKMPAGFWDDYETVTEYFGIPE